MHANKREEVKEIFAGDIVAAVGLKASTTGDTLCLKERAVLLETLEVPEPVIGVAIEPLSQSEQERLLEALDRLAAEDPTFQVKSDVDSGQTIISGMGELHLEIIVDRLAREFKVKANVGKPQVAYRETITTIIDCHGDCIHQDGSRPKYAKVSLQLIPLSEDQNFAFENKLNSAEFPEEFVVAIALGIEEALLAGPIAGYPMSGVKVHLIDADWHEDDSDEVAFKLAAIKALSSGVRLAIPTLLEPIMEVEVLAPCDYVGEIMNDINSRRGRIQGVESRQTEMQSINAFVPLAEMFGYATEVRSRSQGRATFSMQFSCYGPVTQEIVRKRIEYSVF
jgi:elongation factor G